MCCQVANRSLRVKVTEAAAQLMVDDVSCRIRGSCEPESEKEVEG